MRKLLFAQAAMLAVTLAGPAIAADLPMKSEAPFVARFSWTGCYVGGQIGGGFAQQGHHRPGRARAGFIPGAGTTTGITTANPVADAAS